MKKSIKVLLTLTSLLLVACGATTSETPSTTSEGNQTTISDVSSESSSEKVIESYTINILVKNVVDGNIEGVKVFANDEEIGTTNGIGRLSIQSVSPSSSYVLRFEKAGYDVLTKEVSNLFDNKNENISLEIDLAKSYQHFASGVAKNWSNYENFVGYVSRNSSSVLVRLISPNKVFTSDGRASKAEVYFSTGQTSLSKDANVHQVIVHSDKNFEFVNCGGLATSNVGVNVRVDDTKTGTTIDIEVPYVALNMTKDDIFGIGFGLWSEVDSDWAPSFALTSNVEISTENPTTYVRVDKNNYCFTNVKNEVPEEVAYNKQEVIGDRNFGVCDPLLVNVATADDIYFKVNKTSTSFVFDMVGFGDFTDSEYLKLVLHTSSTDGNGWNTQASDVSFLISKTKAAKKTNLTYYWDYTIFANDETPANHAPSYSLKQEGYFTLTFEVDFTEIPEYSADAEVSMMMVEFGDNRIYNEKPFTNFMTNNGIGVGDPASQISYQVIQEKSYSVNMEELLKDYTIKFSYDYYAKFERKDDVLTLTVLSFNQLNDNQFVRLIIDTDGVPAEGVWTLQDTDANIVLFKEASYINFGNTNYWDNQNNNFHDSSTTLNTVQYEEHSDGYWTMTLDIDYTELGLGINKESLLKGLLIFFNPTIVNNFEDPNCHSYYGNPAKDAAIQANYFMI